MILADPGENPVLYGCVGWGLGVEEVYCMRCVLSWSVCQSRWGVRCAGMCIYLFLWARDTILQEGPSGSSCRLTSLILFCFLLLHWQGLMELEEKACKNWLTKVLWGSWGGEPSSVAKFAEVGLSFSCCREQCLSGTLGLMALGASRSVAWS